MDKPADMEDRLVDFAVPIINVAEALPNSKAGNHVAATPLRNFAHVYKLEAQASESAGIDSDR